MNLIGTAPMANDPKITIPGQLAIADPYSLFGGKGAMQYNPSWLVGRKGMRIYDEMRRDEQIKAALAFKKHAILAAGWDIVSPEGKPDDWEPAQFVDWNFDRLDGSVSDRIMAMLLELDYGFSIGELIWEQNEDPQFAGKWAIQDIVSIKPHSIRFQQDETGKVLEAIQWGMGEEIHIPVEKLVIMTYQGEWSNPFGRSDLEACYSAWWAKDSANKWLSILLERFGIPPIFAMYNQNKYTEPTLDILKSIITNLQAGTAAIIPRTDPTDVEMWTPELASQVANVFIPALDHYDRRIARGLLMPSLLGATADQQVGSFARAQVVFDVFMFAVGALRAQVEEAINDQIIWRMMAANYPGEEEYPRMKFKPLTQDARVTLMDAWVKLVSGGAVVAREDDEAHIREIMGFPGVDSEPMERPEPEPEDEQDPEDEDTEEFSQNPTIDFAQIERDLNFIEQTFLTGAITELTSVKYALQDSRLIDKYRRDPKQLHAKSQAPLTKRMIEMLLNAFETGRRDLAMEVGRVATLAQPLPRAKPRDAAAFLRRKAITLATNVSEEILRAIRHVLISSLETGMGTQETATAIGKVFEPWLGSDELRDGGVVKPYRLEAIARTESTSAYNDGRVVMARDPELKGLLRGMRWDSILDSRTSEVCQFLDGKIIRMEDPALDALTPPAHISCRSILTAVTISRTVDESEYITPSEVGRAKELSGSGFAGGGSF